MLKSVQTAIVVLVDTQHVVQLFHDPFPLVGFRGLRMD